jgi:hypothetical protein
VGIGLALSHIPASNIAHQVQPKTTATQKLSPSLARQIAEAQQIGARLILRYHAHSLTLINPDRDLDQLRQLATQGFANRSDGKQLLFDPALLHTLDRLSAKSTATKPLALMSLYRPLSSERSNEPHGNGKAFDIAAYGGHIIDSHKAQEAVAGVIAVIQALEPGDYRMGLPKPPNTDPVALAPAPRRPKNWPFLPAPLAVTLPGIGLPLVLPEPQQNLKEFSSRGLRPWVARWQNERGAPLTDIGSPQVRGVLKTAYVRGVKIETVFPDAVDHLHLDVGAGKGIIASGDVLCCKP